MITTINFCVFRVFEQIYIDDHTRVVLNSGVTDYVNASEVNVRIIISYVMRVK